MAKPRKTPPLPSSRILSFSKADLKEHSWLNALVRYYKLGALIGKGAYSAAYSAYPCDADGNRSKNSPELVVKVPIVGRTDRYKTEQIIERLNRMRSHSRVELKHIRERLRGSKHANSIIDLVDFPHPEFELLATVQCFVPNALSLGEWLEENRYTTRKKVTSNSRNIKWLKMLDRKHWAKLALQIAVAVRDVHLRRVTHGDIHPGNIFLTRTQPMRAIFIDFGESFVIAPGNNWWPRKKPNPYLPPERAGSPLHLNEQVDVYSFGMLLFYLASGHQEPLPNGLYPSDRRKYIRRIIDAANPLLIHHEPRIVDIIALSTAIDPVDRPRAADIVDDLSDIVSSTEGGGIARAPRIADTLKRIERQLKEASQKHGPLLTGILEREVHQLAQTIHGLKTKMVELEGTRKRLLRVLIALFENLHKGDSWTVVTSPAVWQNSALGLGGSYSSATIRAILRGASIRRVFVVSVEELGERYCADLSKRLKESGSDCLRDLGAAFQKAIAKFKFEILNNGYVKPCKEFVDDHRDRFIRLIESLNSLVTEEDLESKLAREPELDIRRSSGLFLGLFPVSTLEELGIIRANNPASLVYNSREPNENKRWTLVVTEIRGRIENRQRVVRPQLHALRVFQSVMHKPDDRINYMNDLVKNGVVNIGSDITEFHSRCKQSAKK